MSNETRDKVDALLARHGITYRAVFVPQSASRNSNEKEHTLNWRVSFSRAPVGASERGACGATQSMAIDYQQGIGHVPGYKPVRTLWDEEQLGKPWETGKYGNRPLYVGRPLPVPPAADVLYCIVSDNPHEASFEDWAFDFGYDPDSRKAEATYRACLDQTRNAERIFGRALLADVAVLLENY